MLLVKLVGAWIVMGGPAVKHTVSELSWMGGSWTCEKWGGVYEETWSNPGGELLIGFSRLTTPGKPAFKEISRIEETETGLVLFVEVNPKREKAGTITAFPMKEITKDKVVFENLKHDFPQRVIYMRKPDGGLAARIEGTGSDGKVKGDDFPFRRVKA